MQISINTIYITIPSFHENNNYNRYLENNIRAAKIARQFCSNSTINQNKVFHVTLSL